MCIRDRPSACLTAEEFVAHGCGFFVIGTNDLTQYTLSLIHICVLTRDELDWLNAYHREVFTKLAPHLTEEERDWLAKKCAAIGA